MNLANQRQIDFEVQNTINIKPIKQNTKEFSKPTYTAITATTFVLWFYIIIKLFS